MIKIAILSMQRVINYGSVLQAYSLKEMLEELSGEKVSFIDIDSKDSVPVSGNVSTRGDYNRNGFGLQKAPWLIFRKIKHKALRNQYEKNIRSFQKNELGLNPKSNEEQYDLVVIGSDEVFIAVNHIVLQLYGKVENAKNVVTYAAASGVAQYSNIGKNELGEVESALANIKHMSVRDAHTNDYVGHMYHKEIIEHVDPVLAGTLRFRSPKDVPMQKYLIVYAYAARIADENEIRAIKEFAKKHELKVVCVGGQQLWCDAFITDGPIRMLDYFYHADYVVTDTFHGTVFSIINHCKFAVLQRKSNEFKIKGVLQSVGLEERLVKSMDALDETLVSEINYYTVDKILDEERERTLEYLSMCIDDCAQR